VITKDLRVGYEEDRNARRELAEQTVDAEYESALLTFGADDLRYQIYTSF